MAPSDERTTELTVRIISAYVCKNVVSKDELLSLIGKTHAALAVAATSATPPVHQQPAVPIKHSVKAEYVVCLEDGRRFRSMRRHLRSDHGLSSDEYRKKWKLPANYPMVAPAYAKARSQLAKDSGLGRRFAPDQSR